MANPFGSSGRDRCASALALTALLVAVQLYLVGLHLHSFLDVFVAAGGGGSDIGDSVHDAPNEKQRRTAGRRNSGGRPSSRPRPNGAKSTTSGSSLHEPWIWNYSSSSYGEALIRSSCDPTAQAAAEEEEDQLRLNDPTTALSPCRPRPWIQTRKDNTPQVKILLTSYGWNHPNRTYGMAQGRSQRQHELLQAIVDHPLFDPKGWDEMMANPSAVMHTINTATRYYVFLDVETCFDANYPVYLGGDAANADTRGSRTPPSRMADNCVWLPSCPTLEQALNTSLFRAAGRPPRPSSPTATLVYLDCRGYGQPSWYRRRRDRTSKGDLGGLSFDDSQISIASLSSSVDQLDPDLDQGLPPPAVARIVLTNDQVRDIRTCEAETQRKLFFVFVGKVREGTPRPDLVAMHNASAGIVSMDGATFRSAHPAENANDLLTQAVFAAAPRGHNLFSYRFSEVLSAGAIPVVHSDSWVLPFRRELVDWTECAVLIPEADANHTLDILRRISEERRCRMRRRCHDIYETYMRTPAGTIDGILRGLELVAMKKAREAQRSPDD